MQTSGHESHETSKWRCAFAIPCAFRFARVEAKYRACSQHSQCSATVIRHRSCAKSCNTSLNKVVLARRNCDPISDFF